MGEIGEGWASMASGRDRRGLTRSTKARQQWPWARLMAAGEGETIRERERENVVQKKWIKI